MDNILYNNAYGILGLLADATQKEITKRVKNLEKLVYIDEIPQYDYDFRLYNNLRNLENIKQASQDLSDAKKHILHYFFRLYINNDKNEEIFKSIETNFSYNNIFELYNSSNTKDLIFKKNIAITLTLGLISNKEYSSIDIEKIIYIWKDLLSDEKYAKDFQRLYMLDDELGIDECLFNDLNDRIREALLEIFSDISKSANDVSILAQFINIFDLSDEDLSLSQVEDCYKEIDKYISILKEMNISEDGVFDDEEKATVKKCLTTFQTELNKLKDLNLYDNVKTILLRDTIATTIRLQIIDIFNNLDEDESAQKLLEFSILIAGTEGLKDKLLDDKKQISSIITSNEIHTKLTGLLKSLESKFKDKYSINETSTKEILGSFEFKINTLLIKIPDKDKYLVMDTIAITLRNIAIMLHNKHEKFKESLLVISMANKFAKSEDVKKRCFKDSVDIQETVDKKTGVKGCINSLLSSAFGGYVLLYLVGMLIYGVYLGGKWVLENPESFVFIIPVVVIVICIYGKYKNG